MFGVARYILRHKVGATAVVALAVFYMTPGKQDETAQSNSPWATGAQAAPVAEASMIDGVVDSTVEFLDENDLNPIERADETVASFENTSTAMGDANARN
jgi:hypothetical protein